MAKKSPVTGLNPYDPADIFPGDWDPSHINMFDPLNTTETTWKALGWEPYRRGGEFNFYDPLDLDQRLGISPDVIRAVGTVIGAIYGQPEIAIGANAAAGSREGGIPGAQNAIASSLGSAFAGDFLGDIFTTAGENIGGGSFGEFTGALGRQLGQAGVAYLGSQTDQSLGSPSAPATVMAAETSAPTGQSAPGPAGLNISNSTAPDIYPWRVSGRRS